MRRLTTDSKGNISKFTNRVRACAGVCVWETHPDYKEDKWWTAKDLEESSLGLHDVLSQKSPEATEENLEDSQSR
jgi:hypothetical protein